MQTLKKTAATLALLGLAASGAHQAQAQTVYVSLVGSTATPSGTSAATPVSINTYSPAGTSLSTIFLPSAAATGNNLTLSGNSSSEGELSLSGDGGSLLIGGYNAATGTAAVAATTSATVSRVVGVVSVANASVDTSTALSNAFSGGNIRGVASADGTTFFMTGSNTGVMEATKSATTATIVSTTKTNTREVSVVGGNVVFSTGSATTGVYTITGTPTSTGNTAALTATTTSSPYGFVFASGLNTLYIADSSLGLEKYTLSGGTYSLAYSLAPAALTGLTGLTGLVAGVDGSGNSVLYGVSPTNLFSFTDTGSAFTSATLATAATNTAFRGVAFASTAVAPTPEPSSLVAMFLGAGALGLLTARRRTINAA